ncbi:hypothetical protein ACTHGU_13615 [Chitinophagaceae bacterium MMS25-I14]
MRFAVYTLLLLIISSHGHVSQGKDRWNYKGVDTSTYWYKEGIKLESALNIQHLTLSRDKFSFRVWLNGQVIDVRTNDFTHFYGVLTTYTKTHPDKKERQNNIHSKVLYSQLALDTGIAHTIYSLSRAVERIPTGDSIKKWGMGVDGITYTLETSTPAAYVNKNYWSPDAQDSNLKEAWAIQHFIDTLYIIAPLKAANDSFSAKLSPGTYCTDGLDIFTKPSPEIIAAWERSKPYYDYLDSVKPRLNAYLTDALNKIFHGSFCDCFSEIRLRFSVSNKLIKIKYIGKLNDREDKRKYRQCCNAIKHAFRKIKIDFVHSQIPYWKEFHYRSQDKTISIY